MNEELVEHQNLLSNTLYEICKKIVQVKVNRVGPCFYNIFALHLNKIFKYTKYQTESFMVSFKGNIFTQGRKNRCIPKTWKKMIDTSSAAMKNKINSIGLLKTPIFPSWAGFQYSVALVNSLLKNKQNTIH